MPRARLTERDDSLAHQIRLVTSQARPATHIIVSCNCRLVVKGTTHMHEPIAEIRCTDDPWVPYNNPLNHNHKQEEFVPREHHSANQKVVWVP